MVVPTRRTLRPDQLRLLNTPRPLRVLTHPNGEPKIVQRRRKGVAVAAVRDCWRIDDRWWTEQPVSRMYYELELANGEVFTLFHDLIADHWLEHH